MTCLHFEGQAWAHGVFGFAHFSKIKYNAKSKKIYRLEYWSSHIISSTFVRMDEQRHI